MSATHGKPSVCLLLQHNRNTRRAGARGHKKMHKCKGISESCFIIKFCIFYPLVYILTIHTHNEYTYHCALRMPTGIESSVRQRGFGHLTFIIAILQIYIKKMKTLLERARDTTLSSSMLIIKIDSWDPSLFACHIALPLGCLLVAL